MFILGIETSCDETAASLIEIKRPRSSFPEIKVYSNVVSSQVELHRSYGGVVPHLAAREHEENLPIVLRQALRSLTRNHAKQNAKPREKNPRKPALGKRGSAIGLIAVTIGPGLAPCLIRGVNFAKDLARKWQTPIIGVDHMEAHFFSALLQPTPRSSRGERAERETVKFSDRRKSEIRSTKFETKTDFPAIALLVSGGHTQLWLIRQLFDYRLLGETRDDAAGEAFDKTARLLGLPYPGGPEVAKLAQAGNPNAIAFPRPMLNAKNYDFSFSGLKTAVLYYLREKFSSANNESLTNKRMVRQARHPERIRGIRKFAKDSIFVDKQLLADVAASFQQAAVDVLVSKTMRAVREFRAKTLLVGGGVAANELLCKTFSEEIKKSGFKVNLRFPPAGLTGDNALMIAIAGFFRYRRYGVSNVETLDADANHRLDMN